MLLHESDETVFSYSEDVDVILSTFGQDWMIFGAPHMGKSSFLRKLQYQLPTDYKVVLFRGAHENPSSLIKVLNEPVVLLIDDINLCFNGSVEKQLGIRGSLGVKRIIATSSVPIRESELNAKATSQTGDDADEVNEFTIEDSLALVPFQKMWLDPWLDSKWENTQQRLKAKALSDMPEEHQDKILAASGGHPALLVGAEARCRVLMNIKLDISEQTIEDYLVGNYSYVMKSALEWASKYVSKSSINVLLDYSAGNDETLTDLPQSFEFKKAGLINTVGRIAEFPCHAIRRCLCDMRPIEVRSPRDFKPTTSRQEIGTVTLQPAQDGHTGSLVWVEGQQDKALRLSKSEWRIVNNLMQTNGEPLSIEDLIDAAHFKSIASARSTLQRLQAKLHRNSIKSVLQSVRGEGYVFLPDALKDRD